MKKIAIYLTAALTLAGCDFLDFDESSGKTQDEAYGYFENVKMLGNAAYRSLPIDFGTISGAFRESATDNAIYRWDSNAVYDIYNNVWSPLNLIDDQWSNYYSVIYDINSFLRDYSEENLERHQWDANYPDNIKQARMSLKENTVLRALYYFELVKRYGDVPLLTEPMKLSEINQVEKTPATEVLDFVAKECKSVADDLPLSHNDFYGETGRVTKGAALAIRARALLYAASPLFIGSQSPAEAYQKAAEAAYDVIAMDYYKLEGLDKDPLFGNLLGNEVLKSKQLIFETRQNVSNTLEKNNLPVGFANGANTGNTPTQNLADAFEMKDGSTFDWNNPTHVANIYYDPEGNPTRDPRFYLTILCNGSKFMGKRVDTYEGSAYGAPVTGATQTGYYLKKLLNENVSLDPTQPVTLNHHFPNYRYAEVLLNYAEAMNEWQGPDYTDTRCPLSARAALNQVRQAANMPDVTVTDKAQFAAKVKNERRVELAFEDHRFWDIRRWKTGNVVEEIYGVNIRRNGANFSYTRQQVQTRVWEDKMYLYPIPQKETYVNGNLTQNPGW